jgi:hypothetical protein
VHTPHSSTGETLILWSLSFVGSISCIALYQAIFVDSLTSVACKFRHTFLHSTCGHLSSIRIRLHPCGTCKGIDPATFRFVAQCLNHCATARPRDECSNVKYTTKVIRCQNSCNIRPTRVASVSDSAVVRCLSVCLLVTHYSTHTQTPYVTGRHYNSAQRTVSISVCINMYKYIHRDATASWLLFQEFHMFRAFTTPITMSNITAEAAVGITYRNKIK